MSLILSLNDLPPKSVKLAGGKGASLADMLRADLPVPPGFVVTANAFRTFLNVHDGLDVIRGAVDGLDVHAETNLSRAAEDVRAFIMERDLPDDLLADLGIAYADLGRNIAVAVRSSAISEDSEDASFAGQQETFLNISGAPAIARHIQECWASFFTARALFYRAQKGSLEDTEIAVVIQQMILPEKSGVLFTIDPVQGRRDHMLIEGVFGLGEGVVSGMITPDHYVMDRDSGELVREHIAPQRVAIVHDENGGTRQVQLDEVLGNARVLSDGHLARLLALGLQLEDYFGSPQDVEWCIAGDEVFLLQSRPITTA
jgi:pyruvate,water dikinase